MPGPAPPRSNHQVKWSGMSWASLQCNYQVPSDLGLSSIPAFFGSVNTLNTNLNSYSSKHLKTMLCVNSFQWAWSTRPKSSLTRNLYPNFGAWAHWTVSILNFWSRGSVMGLIKSLYPSGGIASQWDFLKNMNKQLLSHRRSSPFYSFFLLYFFLIKRILHSIQVIQNILKFYFWPSIFDKK